jgi:hypothetical protein
VRRQHLDALFLIHVYLGLNCVLLFWELLVFQFLLGISETLLGSLSALHDKVIPLLDVYQLLMLFAGTLMYLEPKTFSLMIFYNGPCTILRHWFYATCLYICNHFSPHNGLTIANIHSLLFTPLNDNLYFTKLLLLFYYCLYLPAFVVFVSFYSSRFWTRICKYNHTSRKVLILFVNTFNMFVLILVLGFPRSNKFTEIL